MSQKFSVYFIPPSYHFMLLFSYCSQNLQTNARDLEICFIKAEPSLVKSDLPRR